MKWNEHLPDSSCCYTVGDGDGFVDVFGDNGSSQSIGGLIGPLNGFLDSLELEDGLDRSEDLK